MKALEVKKYTFLSLVIIIALFIFNNNNYVIGKPKIKTKHILVLNSYNYGFRWSDELVKGIEKGLYRANKNVSIRIEYMDTRFKDDDKYYVELFNLYKYKYKDFKFDLIISTDNAAFNFLLRYGAELCPNTPKVFCGVNHFNKSMLRNVKDYTGIAENEDVLSTIDAMIKLHPNAKKIVCLLENTSTGESIKKYVLEAGAKYRNKIMVSVIQGEYIDEIIKKLPKDDHKTLVLLSATFKDRNTDLISAENSTKAISDACKVPIYTLQEIYLSNNIVGGKVISAPDHGLAAALMANRILKGEKASAIKVKYTPITKYVFNYKGLMKYNINSSELPPNSLIINKPTKYYYFSRNNVKKTLFLTIIIFSSIIIILIVSIVFAVRKRNALIESEEMYRTLVELHPECICIRTEDEILFANDQAAKLCGFNEPKEMEGVDIKDLFEPDPDYIEGFIEGIQKLYETGVMDYVEEKLFCKINSKIIDVETAGKRINYNGRVAYMILFKDITEKKKMERTKHEMEKNAMKLKEAVEIENLKTEFLANISHELRTPINVILGIVQIANINYVEELENVTLKKRHIDILKQNCYRLIRIVNNLIDMTKIDSGYFELKLVNYDIIKLAKDITFSIDDYIKNKGLKLRFNSEIEEKIIAIDPDLIERIILNLFSNAIKFTQSGGKIYINIREEDNFILISIKDTGVGIKEELQGKLFKRFIQADKSFSRNREGSGIGLSLIKSLAEMHNGDILLKSKLGEGTEFIVKLPIRQIEQSDENSNINMENSGGIERINIEFSDIY